MIATPEPVVKETNQIYLESFADSLANQPRVQPGAATSVDNSRGTPSPLMQSVPQTSSAQP